MKKTALLTMPFVFFLCFAGTRVMYQGLMGASAPPASACSSTGDIYTQSFEGAGYAANGLFGVETDPVTSAGTVDPDYTADVKAGSHAVELALPTSYDTAEVRTVPDKEYTEAYVRVHFKITAESLSDGEFFYFYDIDDGTDHIYVGLQQVATDQLQIYARYKNDGASTTDVGATNISINTWYYFELYIKDGAPGAGGDLIFKVDGVEQYNSTGGLSGKISNLGVVRFDLDPASSDSATFLFDCHDISSTGWLGE